jgi:hypothetical protein
LRGVRALAAATVGVLLVALPAVGAAPDVSGAAGPPVIELVSQTPVAVPGQPFVADLRLTGVPAEGSISLVVHHRIRSRSELAVSMEGDGLRCCIRQSVTPVSALPDRPGGVRRVTLPLAPAPGGLPLPTEGVYPLELTAQDGAGQPLGSLVTHLIVPPEGGDDAPNLAVAVVAEIDAAVALQPDGAVDIDRDGVAEIEAIVAGLAAAPGVPASLAIRPETVEALQQSPEPADVALVEAMRGAAAERLVLRQPYVEVDVDSLARADLLGELVPQHERADTVLHGALGVAPDGRVQVAPPALGSLGLRTLAFAGATKLLLHEEALEPLPDGILTNYSLAQPFVVAVPESSDADDRTPGEVLGLAPDPIVVERLAIDGTAGLVVSRVLAELALLRLEQPSLARTAVVPLRAGLAADTVEQLLRALGTGRPFEPVTLPRAFEHAAPVLDGGGNPAERALVAAGRDDLSDAEASAIAEARADLRTFRSLVGSDSALPEAPNRHVLVAAATGLDADEREAHLEAASAAIAEVTSQVSMPSSFTLTLAAREGTIPLTLRNDSGVPLRVSVRLRSQKLEFPDGATIDRTLTEPTTRIDVRVRSRATGAFPVVIDVRSPDGLRTLATSRYTVRSTAVSGVGLGLSIGAGVFLIVWWARHWRRTRRSKRLIAANGHPATATH